MRIDGSYSGWRSRMGNGAELPRGLWLRSEGKF